MVPVFAAVVIVSRTLGGGIPDRAGLFFAWFDAGVGFGGPVAGVAAALSGPDGALVTAAVLVASAPLVAGALKGVRRRNAHDR